MSLVVVTSSPISGPGGVGSGEGVGTEVAAASGPLVMLPGEHGADQPDRRVAVGEDADDVGAPGGWKCSATFGNSSASASSTRDPYLPVRCADHQQETFPGARTVVLEDSVH